jgi:hypothetical protein
MKSMALKLPRRFLSEDNSWKVSYFYSEIVMCLYYTTRKGLTTSLLSRRLEAYNFNPARNYFNETLNRGFPLFGFS